MCILIHSSTCLKVLIQETEEQRFLGVGVVWKKFGNHAMPGSKDGTVGYLVDEGKIFGPLEPINPEGIDCNEISVTRHSRYNEKNKLKWAFSV